MPTVPTMMMQNFNQYSTSRFITNRIITIILTSRTLLTKKLMLTWSVSNPVYYSIEEVKSQLILMNTKEKTTNFQWLKSSPLFIRLYRMMWVAHFSRGPLTTVTRAWSIRNGTLISFKSFRQNKHRKRQWIAVPRILSHHTTLLSINELYKRLRKIMLMW